LPSGSNPDPNPDPDPGDSTPTLGGKYNCPFDIYQIEKDLGKVYKVYVVQSKNNGFWNVNSDASYFGPVLWRNWDKFLSQSFMNTHKGCRGNGWIDLKTRYFTDTEYDSNGKPVKIKSQFDVIRASKADSGLNPTEYFRISGTDFYISGADVSAVRDSTIILGFWHDSSSPSIPTDWTLFNKSNCSVYWVGPIPSLEA
jgi:hypothetical protein